MSTEIAAHEYERVATMVDSGKTLEEALAIVRKTPTARQNRPGREEAPKTTQSTDMADRDAPAAKETPRRSKYGNVKTEVDGIPFDSLKEAARYRELRDMAERGEIDRLTVQPRFPLHVLRAKSNTFVEIGSYVADFRYTDLDTGQEVIEDVKSSATAKKELYRWKRKHVESQYGIEVKEV